MENTKKELTSFLIDTFDVILRTEEFSLSKGEFKNLSIREMHVIDAVVKSAENNTAKQIAKLLHITQSTLTTTVNTLEKKGMLLRRAGEKDRRVVRIFVTDMGKKAYEKLDQFRREMVENCISVLSEEEAKALTKGLSKISGFFSEKLYE